MPSVRLPNKNGLPVSQMLRISWWRQGNTYCNDIALLQKEPLAAPAGSDESIAWNRLIAYVVVAAALRGRATCLFPYRRTTGMDRSETGTSTESQRCKL
jgi:hypothetical protein